MLLRNLYPDEIISSVYELNWEKMAKLYKGVIFDIDNTLVPHGAPADAAATALFERIHQAGMRTALASNNGEARVKPFADRVMTPYVCKAGKPKRSGYERAMQAMGTEPGSTLFIGDQIFTDIWGANRAGLHTMLTEPVDIRTDEIQITVKRLFERPFRRAGKSGSFETNS